MDTMLSSGILGRSSQEFWQTACQDNNQASTIPHFDILTGFGSSRFQKICDGIDMINSLEETEDQIKALLKESGTAITTTPAQPPPTTNNPPTVGQISATLNPPNTFYSITASDPDGDQLSYTWTNSNNCGTFTSSANTATWNHPHPPCGEETYHPGTITVIVNDGHGHQITRTYDKGSQDSSSSVPAPAPTPATVSANPVSVSGSHKIGTSPCPTPLGTVSLASNQQGIWSLKSKPIWMDVSVAANQATVAFNCDIDPVSQTLNGNIVFSFSNSNGAINLTVPVTIQVT
jgi:hypothetical protein